MKRIIWHWTAGGHTPSDLDKSHYHFVIDGDGNVHKGKWPVEANEKPVKGKYAAHTLGCNTGSIGVSVAAMAGAVESPFDFGRAPITANQIDALVALSRKLGVQYGIPVTPETMLSHAEVQPTLKIRQRGKWDIAWLPGMDKPGNPVAVGNKLRAMVASRVNETPVSATRPVRHVIEALDTTKPAPSEAYGEPGETAGGNSFGAVLALIFGGAAVAVAGAWETVSAWVDGVKTWMGF